MTFLNKPGNLKLGDATESETCKSDAYLGSKQLSVRVLGGLFGLSEIYLAQWPSAKIWLAGVGRRLLFSGSFPIPYLIESFTFWTTFKNFGSQKFSKKINLPQSSLSFKKI